MVQSGYRDILREKKEQVCTEEREMTKAAGTNTLLVNELPKYQCLYHDGYVV